MEQDDSRLDNIKEEARRRLFETSEPLNKIAKDLHIRPQKFYEWFPDLKGHRPKAKGPLRGQTYTSHEIVAKAEKLLSTGEWTLNEVGEELKVSPRTIQKWFGKRIKEFRQRGRLPEP